ncbi:MAG TPA: transglycosylase SLT domain-containing protein [Lysobacter sp.]|nr:transglycosylase SLT domain-containing protein [Lysobacter sp.]
MLAVPFIAAGQAGDAQVQAALQAAEAGQPYDAASIAASPVAGWVEYASLRRNIDTIPLQRGQDFLARYRGRAVAEAFREIWLPALSRRQDWAGFLAAWSPSIESISLRCVDLNARQALGQVDATWTADAQAIWRSGGKPLPAECDAPFALLASRGGLPPALRWERIDQAAGEWQPAAMREAAQGLPADEAALANDYASFFEAINERALDWPKTERSRWMASQGLARLAKSVPVAAEAQLPKYAQALGFTEADRGRVLYQVALQSAASYEPEGARRLAAVPLSAYDDKLHELQVREALARSDWAGALAAIRRMGDAQRSQSRWTYFEARLSELTGDKAGAQALYAKAAAKPEFHGFLAADRIGQAYRLCPLIPHDAPAARDAVARTPALVRALALYRIDRRGWAQREWDDALSRFSDDQRRIAVGVAEDAGWFDRGVFGLVKVGGKSYPEESRLYLLRFPMHHDATIRREAARNGLDPAWVAGEIRSESVFDPKARSSANARGLMQLLPGTGAEVARKLGLPWGGADSLYDPDTNITLGSAYLRQLLDKYGKPYQTIAAYNAGPAPVARWTSQRPSMDPDFWIETISYKETREYVARVLAFSTIYDWRLNGDAVRLTDRMNGVASGRRINFTCPLAAPPSP